MAGSNERFGHLRQVAALAAAMAAATCAPASAAEVPSGEEAVVLLREADGAGAREDLRAATAGLDVVRAIPEIGAASVDLPGGITVPELRDRLASDPAVKAVERNIREALAKAR